MADRSVKVTLSAQVQGYIDGMQQAARVTREAGTETEKLAQQGQAFDQVGKTALVAGGAMAAGLGLATKAAIDWESAWAGVTKTVDGSPEEMAALEGQLRDLAGVLPSTHEEIAAVAEAAGQLGIQRENVAGFTKTMIDLGETTNLSAEEAATSLARFTNIMGTSQGDVDKLGSALVDLGNNYATTEAEILEMAMRLAGAGKQIGMSEGEVLGLSTALSSVGIEAEAGGSAMSKVMIDIAASVEEGGDRLGQFADVAGVSASTFAEKWRTEPGEALALFVQGLANAESQGQSTLGILADLDIKEVRMRDALLRSAAAADQFSEAMGTGNEAFGENTALTAEAEKRYETTAAQLEMMKNKIVDAAISLGESFLPALEMGADFVGGFADTLSGLDGPMNGVVAWAGAIATAVLLGGGVFMAAVPKVAAYKAAIETLGTTAKRVDGFLRTAGKGLGVVGAAATAAGIAASVMNAELEKSRSSSAELTSAMRNTASDVDLLKTALSGQSGVSKFFVGDLLDEMKNLDDIVKGDNFWEWFTNGTSRGEVRDRIAEIGTAMANLADTDMESVTKSFKELTEGFDSESLSGMLNTMPDFRDKLIQMADGMGVATDDATLLKIATGELKPPTDESAEAAKSAAQEYVEQADAAAAAADQLRALVEQLNAYNELGQSAEDANAAYQKSLADAEEYIANAQMGIEGYTTSMDANTEAGSANRAMFAGIAADSQEAAQKIFEQELATKGADKAQQNYTKRLTDGRQALIDQITELTGNKKAAEEFADAVYQIPQPDDIKLMADASQATESIKKLQDAKIEDKILRIDPDAADAFKDLEGVQVYQIDEKTAYVVGNNQSAMDDIAKVVQEGIPGKTAVIKADDTEFWKAYRAIQLADPITKTVVFDGTSLVNQTLTRGPDSANGNMFEYANGGFGAGIYSGGTPLYKFAEPETGWEAFISGKPSERERNRQIWVDAGERLGVMGELKAVMSQLASGRGGVQIGSVEFSSPQQRQNYRDLYDTVLAIERRGY